MNRPTVLILAWAMPLAGCCGAALAAPAPQLSVHLADLLGDQPVLAPPAIHPARAAHASPIHRSAASKGAGPLARVDAAIRDAVREPSPDDFLGAVQVYPWNERAVFRLYAAPGAVSDIALQPGETLVSVAAGDTIRWIIGDTTSGSGATRRTHILVKPSSAGLATNLVIATDRRVYHVDARSNPRTAMTGISWAYPEDALVALRGTPGLEADPVAAGVAVDQLNFNYRIEGDNPPWRPVRAFDDGRQVFIEFAPSLARQLSGSRPLLCGRPAVCGRRAAHGREAAAGRPDSWPP